MTSLRGWPGEQIASRPSMGANKEGVPSLHVNEVEGPGSQSNQAVPGLPLLFTPCWASVGSLIARNLRSVSRRQIHVVREH